MIWIYYRFISQRYSLISLYTIDSIKYVDIVPIYVLIKLFCGFINIDHLKKKSNNEYKITISSIINTHFFQVRLQNSGFIKDDPIDENEPQNFRRNIIANKIVNQLINTDTKNRAYAFGIAAPWGAGKTSLINIMKVYIPKKDSIIIDFKPYF